MAHLEKLSKLLSRAEAIAFDMDGVLVDSEIYWHEVEENFLSKIIPGWSVEDQQSILGMSLYTVYNHLVRQYGLKISREEYVGFYAPLARRIYGEQSQLLVKDIALFKILGDRFSLALASSSPHAWIDIVLERFALRSYFSIVRSSDDVEGEGKPSPRIYRSVVEELGIPAERVLAIEDSKKGVMSAKAAGMLCVGFRSSFNEAQDLSLADHEVRDLWSFAEALTLELN